MDLGVGGQQVKMLRLPAGEKVQIKLVAQGGGGDYRVLLVKGGKLDKRGISISVDDGPLFNPAHLVLFGSHLEKAPAMIEHFQRLAVGHLGHAIGDGGYPVMEIHLAGGDVHRLVLLMAEAVASTGQRHNEQQRQQRRKCAGAPVGSNQWDWSAREQSRWRSS